MFNKNELENLQNETISIHRLLTGIDSSNDWNFAKINSELVDIRDRQRIIEGMLKQILEKLEK